MLHFGASDAMPRYATPRLRQNVRNYGRANVTSLFSTGYTVGVVAGRWCMVRCDAKMPTNHKPSKHQGSPAAVWSYCRAARIRFCDSRGSEVLWVGVCAPHGWNLTEISDSQYARTHSQVKANSTLDCRDPPNFPKVAQSQAGFSQAEERHFS
jgi:hypothetical protein